MKLDEFLNNFEQNENSDICQEIAKQFYKECIRLANSGAVNEIYPAMIYKVALENLADSYPECTKSDYKNLQKF